MNVLIVFAHPERHSFSGALLDCAVDTLTAAGCGVEVSDLYRNGFAAAGGPADFAHASAAHFDYQAEQRRAFTGGTYAADITAEQAKIARADLLMLNFPLWWFGVPAILKGWIDRVMAVGFAYDSDRRFERGKLAGRHGMVTVTTGSPAERFVSEGARAYASMADTLRPLQQGLFPYVGITPVAPFVAHAPSRASDATRAEVLAAYGAQLAHLATALQQEG